MFEKCLCLLKGLFLRGDDLFKIFPLAPSRCGKSFSPWMSPQQNVSRLVLVPSRELAQQVGQAGCGFEGFAWHVFRYVYPKPGKTMKNTFFGCFLGCLDGFEIGKTFLLTMFGQF